MKYILLSFGILCSCLAKAQNAQIYQSTSNNGLCKANITLYADSNFFYESVCEASSHIYFGKWTKKKDTLKLEPVNPKTFAVIKSVEASTVKGDSVWITVMDKNGTNMTSQISTGLEVAGRGSYMFGLDSSGRKKFVYKRSGGKIVFRTLNKLSGQRLEISTDTANYFMIRLNVLADWISSTHADWGETNTVSLLQKGDGLITTKTPKLVFKQKQ